MIYWLDENQVIFPPSSSALREPDGLLAAGGNLNVETLIKAYSLGIFPWYDDPDPILWWSPDPRMVLFPEELHISRSLKKTLRNKLFTITSDTHFNSVLAGCAGSRDGVNTTWITPAMKKAYNRLHEAGYAHSVEAWSDGTLVGGLYGVALGCVFFGESMFARKTDASKVAFVALCQCLQACGFKMIDCQVHTGHLQRFGARLISRDEFQEKLNNFINSEPDGSPWLMLNQYE